MSKKIHIGLIKEGKVPADSRVPLTPAQCRAILDKYENVQIMVAPSPNRCYKDEEYLELGIPMSEDLSDCGILMGVKEVPIKELVADKIYYFFSHTIKKQPYNRDLLLAMLEKNIQMVDYETLKNLKGGRIIGFGRYAGIVGAHNGVRAYGIKTGEFTLPAAHASKDFDEIKGIYQQTKFPAIKIVSTGNGRVATGARETLEAMGIREVSPKEYLEEAFDEAVFVHLRYEDMYKNKETKKFDKSEFYTDPTDYYCDFEGYTKISEIFINGIYWDPRGPVYFTTADMRQPEFYIKVIADITCDIAPDSSVPCTLKATKITDDVFGYDRVNETAVAPYGENTVEVMSVDNLPNELPRDASNSFGEMLMGDVLEEMFKEHSKVIERATIAKNGKLTEHFEYLQDYVDGEGFG